MRENAERAIRLMLQHEGGFVDHPKDPGGATNRGVTIGTLRRLGMDLDGDGDVDLADLKRLTEADAIRVYKRFYWDAVEGDLLPSGLDYAVADYAVNSGPRRAAETLQRLVGVVPDGMVGPVTLAAVARRDPGTLIVMLCDRRMDFLQGLPTWPTFGRGWSRRVSEVQGVAAKWARDARSPRPTDPASPAPAQGLWAAIVALFRRIFGA